MSAKMALPNKEVSFTNSSQGSSSEQIQIVNKAWEANEHLLELKRKKYNIFLYLIYSSDISEFENKIEEVRNYLLEGIPVFLEADVAELKNTIDNDKFPLPHLLAVARLIGPLLENESYSQKAASMIKKLLEHPEPEARYAALEAISFALGEVPIADSLLAKAKHILKTETSLFVIDYLESL